MMTQNLMSYMEYNHWHHFISQELNFAKKLLEPNGLIVVNDYLPWFIGSMEPCGVQKANKFFKAKYQFQCNLLCN